MLPIKKILFPSSFWGIFDFFVLFEYLEKRIKEYYVTREERGSQTYKFKASDKTDVLGNDTRKKSSSGQRC
jgi:hypothetical protein